MDDSLVDYEILTVKDTVIDKLSKGITIKVRTTPRIPWYVNINIKTDREGYHRE